MPEATHLSLEIKAYREKHGLSQRRMGELLELKHPQESVWDWEQGRTPRPATLAKLRAILDADKAAQSDPKTIDTWKQEIAAHFGVSPDRVEITIRM